MKQFFADIPNKWKAVYMLWVLINLILLIMLPHTFKYKSNFYPFSPTQYIPISLPHIEPGLSDYEKARIEVERIRMMSQPGPTENSYDYSEFLIYIIIPVVIYSVIKLWRKPNAR